MAVANFAVSARRTPRLAGEGGQARWLVRAREPIEALSVDSRATRMRTDDGNLCSIGALDLLYNCGIPIDRLHLSWRNE